MRDIGKNIRDLRMKQQMTQDELAEKLFVTRQTISNYETGRSRPDVDMLANIAQALNTDANTLLYGPATSPIHRVNLLRLLPSVIVAFAVTVIYFVLYEYFDQMAAMYFLTIPRMWLGIFGKPAVYLIYGWTAMELLNAFVLLPAIPADKAKKVKIVLFAVIGIYVLAMLTFLIFAPMLSDTHTDFVWGWSLVIYTILGARAGQNSIHLYLILSFLFGILFRLCVFPKPKQPVSEE